MLEKHIGRFGVPHLLALLVTLVAVGWVASAFDTRGEGTSNLELLLPEGERPNWYWTRMENSGYEVTGVNYEPYDFVEYQVMKGGESYAVQLVLDPESGTAAAVTIIGEQVADDRH